MNTASNDGGGREHEKDGCGTGKGQGGIGKGGVRDMVVVEAEGSRREEVVVEVWPRLSPHMRWMQGFQRSRIALSRKFRLPDFS